MRNQKLAIQIVEDHLNSKIKQVTAELQTLIDCHTTVEKHWKRSLEVTSITHLGLDWLEAAKNVFFTDKALYDFMVSMMPQGVKV